MNDSESENGIEEVPSSSVPTERGTDKKTKLGHEHDQNGIDTQSHLTKMHMYITLFVLGILLLIIIYGLFKQNYWLVGSVCFPVIAYGVYKLFDRYL